MAIPLEKIFTPFSATSNFISSFFIGNFDGKFEALDLAELTKKQPWWRKLFGQESGPSAEKYSVATQLVIGGVTGW